MSIFGPPKEQKTQLYFREDNKFQFVRRRLEYSCLVERKGDLMLRGWKHFYGNQLFFPGYKKISADAVTLGFARDIILDPFDKIPKGDAVSEKPKAKDRPQLKKWIAQIAENQRHVYRSKRKNAAKEDLINNVLVGVIVVMIAGWIIRFASG